MSGIAKMKHSTSKSTEKNIRSRVPAEVVADLRKICDEIDDLPEFGNQPGSKTVE